MGCLETGAPYPFASLRIGISGGTWASALSSGAGTIVPEPTFPSRQGEEEAEVRPSLPQGKLRGRALRAAFWERKVFWERGTRHSITSRLRGNFITAAAPERKRRPKPVRRRCGQRGSSKTHGRAWGLERLHRRGALAIWEGEEQEAGATQTLASPHQCLEMNSLVFPQSTCCSLSVTCLGHCF